MPARLRRTLLAVSLALTAGRAAAADPGDWVNPGTGDWFTATNWAYGTVPQGPLAIGNIFNGGLALLSAPGAEVDALTVGTSTAAQTGYLYVSGAGRLAVHDTLGVGSGSLQIFSGAQVTVSTVSPFLRQETDIGASSGASILLVSGVNSALNSFTVDSIGTANVTVENGGRINASLVYAGGSTTVTGPGSVYSIAENLSTQGGSFTVANGATTTVTNQVTLGLGGTINVNGSGSELRTNDLSMLYDGQFGSSASLNVNRGVVFSKTAALSGNGFVGGMPNANATVAGGIWINAGSLDVGGTRPAYAYAGAAGNGSIAVTNGGYLGSGASYLGNQTGSYGIVTVDGAGSRWTSSSDITVGNQGGGIVQVINGGTLQSVRGQVGIAAGSSGAVTVSGTGSTWTASGSQFIGNGGNGQLDIADHGVVTTTGNGYLGFAAGSQGVALITGSGSTWNIVTPGTNLNIGGTQLAAGGSGTLDIENGGSVNTLATNLYATGRIGLTNDATFTGHITSDGGLIGTSGVNTLSSDITLKAGGLFVRPGDAASTVTFTGNIDGIGGLTKNSFLGTGSGTLVLTGNDTYTGATTVNIGKLIVNGSSTSATTVTAGTLGGNGSIAASVQIGDGVGHADAALMPGQGIGRLATGDLTFMSDGVYAFELDSGAAIADQVAVSGSVTIVNGAMFVLGDLGTALLAAGTTFVAIDNDGTDAINGRFANLSEGEVLLDGLNEFMASYFGGTGNDLVLTVLDETAIAPPPGSPSPGSPSTVPEPPIDALILAGVAAFVLETRRRARAHAAFGTPPR